MHNHTYEEAVKLFIAPDGEEREWVKRCMQLAEGEDLDDVQSINQVVTSLLDADGKFKPGAKQLFERRETVGED